jgi:hypothetical protein
VEDLYDDHRCLLYITEARDNEIRLGKEIPLAGILQYEDFIPLRIHALDCLRLVSLFIDTDCCITFWSLAKLRLWEVEGLDDYVTDQIRNSKS